MGVNITFDRPDGKSAAGYLAKAADSDAPGIVVIQEWWGLQGQIKGLCDRFAALGFNALAPDLYAGVVVPYHDVAAANKAMAALDFMDATEQTVRGAARFLAKNGKKVGLTGFCLGGAVTIIGAAKIPELSAAVAFYGIPPESVAGPADIRVPLQCHFATRDDWCTPALVDRLENGLKAAGKSYEIFRYEADHAFMNEERQGVYNRQAAEQAWQRAATFLRQNLA
jgi:carboxymethylenebutenolidase